VEAAARCGVQGFGLHYEDTMVTQSKIGFAEYETHSSRQWNQVSGD
jgi:hypothetical protein